MEIQGGESREELGGRIRTQKPKKTCCFYLFFAKHVVFLQVFQCFFLENVVFVQVFQYFLEASNRGGGGSGGGSGGGGPMNHLRALLPRGQVRTRIIGIQTYCRPISAQSLLLKSKHTVSQFQRSL
ncbi:MAG: hypothetical protein VXW26_15025, partial [SAR324 cluster bacterium]|nr:hypothetical protein [SAR324 cluster bacterium]